MDIFATEIDDNFIGNSDYLEKWEDKFGTIYRKLLNRTCVNCSHKPKEDDHINYVACYNGKLKLWHTKCPNSKKTNQ